MFRLLATSEQVAVARGMAVKFAGPHAMSALFLVDGDRRSVEAGLDELPEVELAETAPADGGFYLLAVLDPGAIPLLNRASEAIPWRELVVVPPIAYRDGAAHARLVGADGAASGFVEGLPEAIDVEVHAVGERGVDVAAWPEQELSDRQREAVRAALDLGYYDQPRGATHEDVAATLDCAPSTASEHLRKAEAELVRSAMR